jgi:hypothetical protein
MANVALDRALTSLPGYRLAQLLSAGLAAGLPPSDVRALIAGTVDAAGEVEAG